MSKVYSIVSDTIIKKLENAVKENKKFTWVKPWTSFSIPKNFITKKPYRGINLLLLDDPGFYISFKQLIELQKKYPFLKLKKGCKKQMIVYWSYNTKSKITTKEDEEENDISEDQNNNKNKMYNKPIFLYYNVYNQKDIEGFEKIIPEQYKGNDIEIPNIKATRLCKAWSKIVKMEDVDIDKAYYVPSKDYIKIPPISCYKNINEYFATKFHEMIHSTGHKSRLNRFEENSYFGNEPYSKEELVAEIGSQMLLAECGLVDDKVNQNSIAYLQSWLKVLKNDITLITYAAQKAQKACDLIFNETNFLNNEENIQLEKIV